MPSSTSRSETRGRPVRPCTAGLWGGISGSNSAHSSSLISRGGGEDAGDDMPRSLRRVVRVETEPDDLLLQRLLIGPSPIGGANSWSAARGRLQAGTTIRRVARTRDSGARPSATWSTTHGGG